MDASASLLADPWGDRGASVTASYARRPALTVLDGRGGALSLDLAAGELRWLVDACRRMLRGAAPAGASALKVRAAEKWYLVSSAITDPSTATPRDVTIANLYDPGETVTLASDLAEMLATMIDEAIQRAEGATALAH